MTLGWLTGGPLCHSWERQSGLPVCVIQCVKSFSAASVYVNLMADRWLALSFLGMSERATGLCTSTSTTTTTQCLWFLWSLCSFVLLQHVPLCLCDLHGTSLAMQHVPMQVMLWIIGDGALMSAGQPRGLSQGGYPRGLSQCAH